MFGSEDKFKKFNDIPLGQALIDELGNEGSPDMRELDSIIPGFLRHIMS